MSSVLFESAKCAECGSADAAWQCMQVNRGSASDGRLRMHEVHTVFVLSCSECSADMRTVSGDDVALWMSEAAK